MSSNHAMEEDGRRLLGTVPSATILMVNSTRYKINGAQAIAFTDTTSGILVVARVLGGCLSDTASCANGRSVPCAGLAEHHTKEVNREHHHVSSSARVDARTVTIFTPPPFGPCIQSVDQVALLPTAPEADDRLSRTLALGRDSTAWSFVGCGGNHHRHGSRRGCVTASADPGPRSRSCERGVRRGLIHLSCPRAARR